MEFLQYSVLSVIPSRTMEVFIFLFEALVYLFQLGDVMMCLTFSSTPPKVVQDTGGGTSKY